MQAYTGQLKDFPWKIRHKRSHHSKDKNRSFCDNILTFDIETTSAWVNPSGNVIRYHKGQPGEYWNNLTPLALCYIWQFSVDDTVYYGRELTEFKQLLEDLPKDAEIIIWVHNLSFEMHFLQDIFVNMEIFARQPHKPMKLVPVEFGNIEFRCTYMLTRLSLETWGKSLGMPKKTGDLIYNKIRTPLTSLTDKELGYCERDCIVVYEGIKDYLKRYETQDKIPLTQTGTVRQEVKKMMLADPAYHKRIKRLVPHSAKEYNILQEVFSGGYTHANRIHAGSLIRATEVPGGVIEHYDFTSHYPTMMCAFKMPYSPWAYMGSGWPKHLDFDNNGYIFHLRFTRIQCRTYNTYIQDVKAATTACPYRTRGCNCKWNRTRKDNGRVISAHSLEMWLTEQDWLTIKDTYTWDKVECLDCYKSRKAYLPKEFVEYILRLYGNKTELKDVTEEEKPGAPDLYVQSKQYLNGLFGMCVTALVMSDVHYDLSQEKPWWIDPLTSDQVTETLNALRQWTPRERRYFLNFSWGIWITALSRRMLWRCMLNPGNGLTERDVLYCDTDSIFVAGKADFTWYNDFITAELDKAMEHHGLSPDLTRPADPKGIRRQLGLFLREKNCSEFITLGAKRYVERREDGKLYLTVSGVNKEAVYCLHNDIEAFRDGFIFDKDFPTVKKSLHTYVHDQPEITWPDGYRSKYKYGVNLRPNGYHLHMTPEYVKLISAAEELDLNKLPEAFVRHMRGRFTPDEE